ncbi:MAG: aspartate kinase [Myxococcales bacterium]|jgi:diaminopimelate decarboxylase/aspartate kinase
MDLDISKTRSNTATTWVVAKFGGTSVARPDRWQSIRGLVQRHQAEGHRSLVVCSALSGITNRLEKLLEAARAGEDLSEPLDAIWQQHVKLAVELGVDAEAAVGPTMASLRGRATALARRAQVDPRSHAGVMAHGELMSTRLGAAWLRAQGVDVAFADAREMLHAPEPAEGTAETQRYLSATCDFAADPALIARLQDSAQVVITQGFIARDDAGDTVLLGRGGSDTSAAYLASKVQAARLEIWTDVPGMFSANPGAVPAARLVPELGYQEAQTLAGLGAKVLHPRCLRALHEQHIPLHLGSTEHPEQGGTRINGVTPSGGIRAIVSRKGLYLLSMRRPPEWQPVGFMAEVAACFHRHGISMDLVSSSPSEIRATIDAGAFPDVRERLEALVSDLRAVCEPELTGDVASVSLVGHRPLNDAHRYATATRLMQHHDLRLVAHAADEAHLSYVVDAAVVDELVSELHAALFEQQPTEGSEHGPSFEELAAVAANARSMAAPRIAQRSPARA